MGCHQGFIVAKEEKTCLLPSIWYIIVAVREGQCLYVGSSVHNQHIERLWRDMHRCVTSLFYRLFFFLSTMGISILTCMLLFMCICHGSIEHYINSTKPGTIMEFAQKEGGRLTRYSLQDLCDFVSLVWQRLTSSIMLLMTMVLMKIALLTLTMKV